MNIMEVKETRAPHSCVMCKCGIPLRSPATCYHWSAERFAGDGHRSEYVCPSCKGSPEEIQKMLDELA